MRLFLVSLISIILSACSSSSRAPSPTPDAPLRSCGGLLAEVIHQVSSLGMPDSVVACVPRNRSGGVSTSTLQQLNEERLARLEMDIKSINESLE